MPFELEILVCSVLIPAITAVMIAILVRRLLPDVSHVALPLAAAAGCVVGYVLLPDWAPLRPERHWQSILYLTSIAAVVGCVRHWLRFVLLLPVSILAASSVVPNWETLQPGRMILIPLLAAYMAILGLLLVLLPERLRGRTFIVVLTLTTIATAGLIGAEVSAKFGQAAAIVATTFIGCCIGEFVVRRQKYDNPVSIDVMGLIPIFSIATSSFAFAGAIEPAEPLWILLAVPAAPLLLWMFAWGPLSRLPAVASIVLQILVVLAVPIAIAARLYFRSEPADEWSKGKSEPSLQADARKS